MRIQKLKELKDNFLKAILHYWFYTRPMIKFCQDYFGDKKGLIGCEIGLYNGENALNIFKALPIGKMYLIDPYVLDDDCIKITDDIVQLKYEAFIRLNLYHRQYVFIELRSDDAYKWIEDKLDFCYIDGSHNYKQVIKDIKNYYPLIKSKGVIGGHDFHGDKLDVIRAVLKATKNMKEELHTEDRDWWIVKDG